MTMTQKSNIVMKEVDAKTSGMHCVFDHTHCTASHTPTALVFEHGGDVCDRGRCFGRVGFCVLGRWHFIPGFSEIGRTRNLSDLMERVGIASGTMIDCVHVSGKVAFHLGFQRNRANQKPLGPYGTRRDCLWHYD